MSVACFHVTVMVLCVLVNDIGLDVGISGASPSKTLTVAVAVLSLCVLAVMVYVPMRLAVTTPAEVMGALAGSELVHVTVLLVAPTGKTVAVSVLVWLTSRLIVPVGLMLTLVAGTVAVEFVVALTLV